MKELIVVYKFGSRFDGDLTPKEGINLYYLNAREHDGKVLFTINKSPKNEFRDKIKKLIMTVKDGSFAIIADVDYSGKGNKIKPPADYEIPSIWDNEDRSNMAWFALSNIKRITIKKGDFTSLNNKDLLYSISANAYMVYVHRND